MTSKDVKSKYLKFFEQRGHVIVPSAPLVPENDPTTLFTGSGMQPMLTYLLGQPYPQGKTRIVDSQKCFRSQDIEEVGDNRHDTFFEMLGNWSLGDYFKKEQQSWIWEFLTRELNLDPQKLYVTVFEGNDEIPRDDEAVNNWKDLGVSADHIFYYDAKKNWWARTSYFDMPIGEPGGPSSEIFYDFGTIHDPKFGKECHPNCDCGRFMEIGNNVFMTYKKTEDGFVPLEKKNIDFGGGLERLTAAANNDPDIFKSDLYWPIIKGICHVTGKSYVGLNEQKMRIIADHLKASALLISDGVVPGNKGQGYILRRLIRRALFKLNQLNPEFRYDYDEILKAIIAIYAGIYLSKEDERDIIALIAIEKNKFLSHLDDGMRIINKGSGITSQEVFDLYQSHGFPLELVFEIADEKKINIDQKTVMDMVDKHKDLSRTASKGMFKGGLGGDSPIKRRYHTATHLLHAALRKVLGNEVHQMGSNITDERLRFDFSYSDKLTDTQIEQVEQLVNKQIDTNTVVERTEMKKSEALAQGALAFFPEKYPDITSVYKIGNFSMELCGGPHVTSTGEVGHIKINKQEAVSSGVRRIYATAIS